MLSGPNEKGIPSFFLEKKTLWLTGFVTIRVFLAKHENQSISNISGYANGKKGSGILLECYKTILYKWKAVI